MEKTSQIQTLEVKKFFLDGIHTCGTDIEKQDYCQFLTVSHFGYKFRCCGTGNNLLTNSKGFLHPDKNCILLERKNNGN